MQLKIKGISTFFFPNVWGRNQNRPQPFLLIKIIPNVQKHFKIILSQIFGLKYPHHHHSPLTVYA
ncbi:uncharacterized protein DS421_9g265700 [Arachis hypogaea]|nr:uncharacterized protein DS421_9g265700 [Arachis hypogaea]